MMKVISKLWRRAKDQLPSISVVPREKSAAVSLREKIAKKLPQRTPVPAATAAWVGPSGTANSLGVRIRRLSAENITLDSKQEIPEGTKVWALSAKGASYAGVVEKVARAGKGFHVGVRLHRKQSDSTPGFGGTSIWRLDEDGALRKTRASIQNTEPGHIELKVHESIPCPAIVLIRGYEFQSFGSVRACRKQEGGYWLNVEMIGDLRPTGMAA